MSNLKAKYAENLLSDKTCNKCKNEFYCKKYNKEKYNTCLKWEEKSLFDSSDIFRVVRQVFPSMVRGDILKEFAMDKPKDSTFHINYKYTDLNDKNSEKNTESQNVDVEKTIDDFNKLSEESDKKHKDELEKSMKQVLKNQRKYLESIYGSNKKRK